MKRQAKSGKRDWRPVPELQDMGVHFCMAWINPAGAGTGTATLCDSRYSGSLPKRLWQHNSADCAEHWCVGKKIVSSGYLARVVEKGKSWRAIRLGLQGPGKCEGDSHWQPPATTQGE
jgi:hypothetical protein